MGMTAIRCRKCGECCYGRSGGIASAVWREHFMAAHAGLSIQK